MEKLLKRLRYFVSASFIGLVIGILSIYYTLRGSRTHMSMDIAAESNVLDVKHPMPDLAILFQGQDIEEEKSNLKILTVRVINDGEANIREDDYDSKTPFGLEIDGGQVVRAQVVGANSSYLSENVHPRVEDSSKIGLDKIIFDKGKYVSLEILVLHPKSTNPKLRPMGKIAGLDEIAVTNSFQDRDQRSFVDQVFSGPAAVQISRIIAYALLALIAIIVLGFSIAGLASIPSNWKKRKRRRKASLLPTLDSSEREKKRKAIEATFVEYGLEGLNHAQELLNNETELTKVMLARREFQGGSVALDLSRSEMAAIHSGLAMAAGPSSLSPLLSGGLLNLNGNELKIDPDVKQLLADFIGQISGEDDHPVEPPAG